MLEGLVAWVLNNYLGKYVENLNTDQLSVALPSGKVELENLPLKKDAFRHLGLPVEVRAGFIGKVQLQVPVRQIRSAPWLIAIENIYIVAAPVNLDEWDAEAEAVIAHERKVALLDALEAQWRAELEATDASYYATSYSSWLSYGTGLLANIVENLQLKLNDVHIRYEDALTLGGRAFACGLTVQSLAAESCDAAWARGFAQLGADGCSFKLLELQQLAVYWDPVAVPGGLMSDCTSAELTARMSATWRSAHSYLVAPASAVARVCRERTEQPLRSRTRPRIKCNLTLDKVLLNLTSRQYSQAVGCARGLERIARLRAHRALRPAGAVAGGARAWWVYAVKCHTTRHEWLEPRPTWSSCLQAAREARQYVDICLGVLNNPAATLPSDKKAIKDEYEWKTPLHVLKPLREIAMRKVPKSTPVSTPDKPASSGRSMLVHWFPQWWGWYSAPPAPEAAPPDLEEEILDVLADSLENNTLLKRDTVFGQFEFMLVNGSLNLIMVNTDEEEANPDKSSLPQLELDFSHVSLGLECRPRTGGLGVTAGVGAVCVRDRLQPTAYPVLVHTGQVREGLSAMNTAASVMSWSRAPAPPAPAAPPAEPLFLLQYEKKPFNMNCDYKLYVKCQSLEVVYNRRVVRWASQFILGPLGRPPLSAAAVRTRQHLLTHWQHIMRAHPGERRSWSVELDISAPQIFVVEELTSRDAPVLVVDFGRMRLNNAGPAPPEPTTPPSDDHDEECFMTPCSTPPGSLLSPASPPPGAAPPPSAHAIDAANLHQRLYDRYNIEFSDLQILVGRARDNWKYAHTKTSSSLHLLDRFSISLQAERRVVWTQDPQFPAATLRGTLPALVVHLSEPKLAAVAALLPAQPDTPSPRQTAHSAPAAAEDETEDSERSEQQHNAARLFMLQFAIDQMSLEVQSRGRSIAEVQVCGVKLALTARPVDVSTSLSVHSLLLVDALQTYGPDFELLVASHKHVGMDVASGSIRGSEPTSPVAPTSPTAPTSPPPPHALTHALNDLHAQMYKKQGEWERAKSPTAAWGAPAGPWGAVQGWGPAGTGWGPGASTLGAGGGWAGAGWGAAGMVDEEALIAIELCFVKGGEGSEDLRIANILFNNLDIIANQETIVELIGFTQRVLGTSSAKKPPPEPEHPAEPRAAPPSVETSEETAEEVVKEVRTEITFDFHRLGVLLLRAQAEAGQLAAKKIATATLSEAKIQATLESTGMEVSGSLGGVGVVSLCGGVHARVCSAGRAAAPPPALYRAPGGAALTFGLTRKYCDTDVSVSLSLQVASVWYTHSARVLRELRSCVSEFQQYLADLGRSIRAAAADMAQGLVQPRMEGLYANPKLSQSMEGVSPRRRTISLATSVDDPTDKTDILLSITIELETPVVILPRSERSTQVLIAHLGRMSLANRQEGAAGAAGGAGGAGGSDYTVKVRDISLHSLDIAEKLKTHSLTAENMPLVYDAAAGRPVLHDTALHLTVNYNDEPGCEVTGKIVGGLRVTSTREQYVQLVDTLRWMGSDPAAPPPPQPPPPPQHMQSSVAEGAVPTLRLDPAVRAQVLVPPPPHRAPGRTRHTQLRVNFQLPHFTVELRADFGRGEKSMVDLSFREFNVNYERLHPHETNIQMSLHSITMEDLTQDPESKHRMLMVSHTPQVPKAVFVSKSCPDFVTEYPIDDLCSMSSLQQMRWNYNSLPSELNVTDRDGGKKRDSKCGATPPCSPEAGGEARGSLQGEDNLVWISVHIRDPQHPLFEEKFDKVSKLTKVEFNCLKLVVSVDSWVAVIDFFGDEAADEPEEDTAQNAAPEPATVAPAAAGCSTTEMSIRSLSVLLVGCRGEGDICRGQVSRLRLESRADLGARTRSLEGRLGALALADLTPAAPAWRDRLLTHGDHALSFSYRRLSPSEAASSGHDTSLHITTGPVTYAHSRRFVAQIATAASDFSRLRSLIQQARQKVSVAVELSSATRLSLHVSCASPVIAVPVSGRVRAALVAELSALTLDNCFLLAGEPGAAAPRADPACPHREVLDVRRMRLSGLSLWAGGGGRGLRLRRRGAPLLPAPAELLLQIELNCSATHNVPDMTIQGTLSTLQITLDPDQYRLIRGVLAHNLGDAGGEGGAPGAAGGEPMTHAEPPPATDTGQVWTTTCIKLDLHGVSLALQPARGAALATVNFIQSRLLIETDSRLHQDIDLVSQEILVSDTRFASEPANRRGNVFTRIVQPQPERRHRVQAELHARKRGTSSAYTILINNMRLMAIFDWWEAAHHFLMLPPLDPHPPGESPLPCAAAGGGGWAAPAPAPGTVELKLNITDSQVVFVEDASVWDTNAVILKSTTVITYRGAQSARPVSCVLNELEVFSCVLGLEEETALAIVEPCALHMDVLDHHTLRLSTRSLNLRLSYHDMRMFAAMLRSVPEQARLALSGKTESPTQEPDVPANRLRMRAPATRLGALSLRVSAAPAPPAAPPAPSMSPLHAVEVQADCITLCVIDDCCDSDVPLLEVSLSELHVQQDLRKVEEAFSDPILVSTPAGAPPPGPLALRPGPAGGKLTATLSADYYNRVLSGWEPFIEPWKFSLWWEYTLSSRLSLARLQAEVHSDSTLDVNVTHALLDLRAATSAAWTSQSQNSGAEASPKGSPMGHRRRSPFVPYALRNHTGHKLWFTTIVTTCDVLTEQSTYSGPDDSWVCVKAGETEPFSFGARARGRGLGSGGGAPARLHQLAIRLEGWSPPAPVCVDRAGVFWRSMTHTKTEAEARMVLEVSLEGSARKLVTARSALRLLNRLPHAVELRRDHAAAAGQWSGSTPRTATVAPGASWSAPLSPGAPPLWVRPLARAPYSQCVRPLDWRQATAGRPYHGHYQCTAPDRSQYRFSCVVVRERFPPDRGPPCAGHTLTLLPELRLENLLPLELQYRARAADDEPPAAAGALPPGHTQPFHEVNVEEGVELSVKLEGFAWSSPLSVGGAGGAGGAGGSFTARLKLRDAKGRRLYLSARVSVKKTDGIKVCISAPYWLVNRVGLPLVYRAAGGGEAAGQQPEHEVARARAPLLFSIADDAPPTLAVRVGKCDSGTPEWCSPFGLGPGVVVKRLEVRGGGGGDRVYCVGVSVRAGRGRYRHTNIVTLTPRYQLHNNTKMVLQLAQKCTATDLNDPGAISTHVTAPPGSYLPWHWPRWERPQLLCVRVCGAGGRGAGAGARTAWSGATAVTPRSVHLACREPGGGYVFLRVEVVAQGASLFIVLGDSAPLPPPLRLDNHSPLALMFHQVGCGEESVVGAHASLPWALPEPEGGRAVSLRAPGGPRLTLQLDALDTRHSLAYHNFIYVAFARSESGKNPNATSPSAKQNATTVEDVLVLEVPIGSTTVILGKKRYGDRSQLWRRGPNDSLIHEGSSPPQPTDAAGDHAAAAMHAMVLDIEGPAPRPGCPAPLALRRPSPRRASTQAWRLLRGRMTCAHDTLAVTAANTPGARAVLALAASDRSGQPPAEQAVQWQTLRPGSGHLDVRVYADGPTTVLKIVDSKEPESGWLEGSPVPPLPPRREWGARVSLAGVAVSLLASAPPAELVRAELAGVRVDLAVADHVRVALAVEDVQLDNQLLGTPSPVLLYCLNPPPAPGAAGGAGGAALHAAADLALAPPGKYNALFFDHLVVSLAPIAIRLEERLILKLCVWAAWGDDAAATEHVDETDYETQRALQQLCAVHAPRCYIAALRLMPSQVRLSMCTANKLEGELAAVKRRLGLTLIKFEDAAVELEPFQRRHAFETPQYLADMILKHFKDELKWQAAKILGSVDFLGNPLGFVADVSEGVSGLIYEGSVGALLKNVTHGISNSAAKVTESLGDGLERVIVDEAHEETRRRIRSAGAGSHLAAGLRGLGLGLLGGMTSLVKHSYEGAAAEGLPGFLAGVGKGLVGTVTKPVIGVLDLAAETASALRDTSRRSDKWVPARRREPRCAAGAGGLLPRYCAAQAAGAHLLYQLNNGDYTEVFLAYRLVRATPHDIRALLSTLFLRIFTCKQRQPHLVMETHLSNLVSCAAVTSEGAHFVELGVRGGGAGGGGEALRRPRVQCDSAELAAWVARHAAYARQLYHETVHTLHPHTDV